jgi:hypothetical protein
MNRFILPVSLLFIFSSCWDRSPNKIYSALLKNLPNSVQVLHSEDQEFLECCIWLHFKIKKKDLLPILDTLEQEQPNFSAWNRLGAPDWWNPSRLGNNPSCYTWRHRYKMRSKNFYVNESMTEVYYVDQAGH